MKREWQRYFEGIRLRNRLAFNFILMILISLAQCHMPGDSSVDPSASLSQGSTMDSSSNSPVDSSRDWLCQEGLNQTSMQTKSPPPQISTQPSLPSPTTGRTFQDAYQNAEKTGQLDSSSYFQFAEGNQKVESGPSEPSLSLYSANTSSTSPYALDFDLRDMKGFNENNNNIISSRDIEAFIQSKTPNSSMLSEANIGNCFIDAGLKNNINPAFLVAIAYLEGGFGTLELAKLRPECHNTFGYALYSGYDSSNQDNCADSWCTIVERAAFDISNSNSYYKQNLFTIKQIGTNYPGDLILSNIVNLMNELYSFSASRKEHDVQPAQQPNSQETTQSGRGTSKVVQLSGYRPTYIPGTSGYRPAYTPGISSNSQEPIQLGGGGF